MPLCGRRRVVARPQATAQAATWRAHRQRTTRNDGSRLRRRRRSRTMARARKRRKRRWPSIIATMRSRRRCRNRLCCRRAPGRRSDVAHWHRARLSLRPRRPLALPRPPPRAPPRTTPNTKCKTWPREPPLLRRGKYFGFEGARTHKVVWTDGTESWELADTLPATAHNGIAAFEAAQVTPAHHHRDRSVSAPTSDRSVSAPTSDRSVSAPTSDRSVSAPSRRSTRARSPTPPPPGEDARPDVAVRITSLLKGMSGGTLKPHQVSGVQWLLDRWAVRTPCILADEMGLGKTVQVLALLHVLLTSYQRAPFLIVRSVQQMPELGRVRWSGVIVDKGHKLINDEAKVFACLAAMHADHRALLSGTPLQNSVRELVNLLHFLDPIEFPDPAALADEFNVLDEADATARTAKVRALLAILRPRLLRQTKDDADLRLPPRRDQVVAVCMSPLQRELAAAAATGAGTTSAGSVVRSASLQNIIMQCRKVLSHPFMLPAVEQGLPATTNTHVRLVESAGKLALLDRILPRLQARGHKLLIFAQFMSTLDILEDYLIGCKLAKPFSYNRLNGDTPCPQRQDRIDRLMPTRTRSYRPAQSTTPDGVAVARPATPADAGGAAGGGAEWTAVLARVRAVADAAARRDAAALSQGRHRRRTTTQSGPVFDDAHDDGDGEYVPPAADAAGEAEDMDEDGGEGIMADVIADPGGNGAGPWTVRESTRPTRSATMVGTCKPMPKGAAAAAAADDGTKASGDSCKKRRRKTVTADGTAGKPEGEGKKKRKQPLPLATSSANDVYSPLLTPPPQQQLLTRAESLPPPTVLPHPPSMPMLTAADLVGPIAAHGYQCWICSGSSVDATAAHHLPTQCAALTDRAWCEMRWQDAHAQGLTGFATVLARAVQAAEAMAGGTVGGVRVKRE
ncbi:hypothetical protein AMAG_16993 [Allomyces macrogynus ATCC 38327]|uniref:Helicase ATP-binding domain-containing protein n=1 Tax=Allomyces macrogynus (strain ATCC 38327) TaxID=578462 RepID=A0A0L0TD00_ALLM3|nr:hypothetical protein AMAG_16993 [Allomyces macrogynus ATCC 38327]|eukprot:KNE72550.1 hypothetical protein AMAG_16993 [Allomyces macrogynus ATCC 38327]